MDTSTNPLQENTEIFKWKEPLKKDSFNPDEIFCRDEEIKRYANALQDIPDGHGPNNVFVYGPTGVGKTVVTKWMRENVREMVDNRPQIELTITDPINCRDYKTTFQLATAILNALRPEKDDIDTNGLSTNRVFNLLYEEIDEVGGNVVIILDEIDNIPIDARNDFLYNIPRAEAQQNIEAEVGLIGISNDLKFVDSLEPKVRSTLGEREIEFGPYDANQLRTILNYYADLAFYDHALGDGVVPCAAAYAGQERGDVRQGLLLLEKAGEYARSNDDDVVSDAHVEEAYDDIEKDEIVGYFEDKLSTQQGLSYLATTLMVLDPNQDAQTKHIHSLYKNLTTRHSTNAVAERKFYEFLDQLSMLGLVRSQEKNLGRKGGRKYVYEVTDDPADIINAAREIEEFAEILPKRVDKALKMNKETKSVMYEPQAKTDDDDQKSIYQF